MVSKSKSRVAALVALITSVATLLGVSAAVAAQPSGLHMIAAALPGEHGSEACGEALEVGSVAEVVSGAKVTWCVLILNLSDTTATNISLEDIRFGPEPMPLSDLGPGSIHLLTSTTELHTDHSETTTVQATLEGSFVTTSIQSRAFTIEPAVVQGRLSYDAAGSTPLAGALVELTGRDRAGHQVWQTAKSDASGVFEFVGLAPSEPAGFVVRVAELPPGVPEPNHELRRRVEVFAGDVHPTRMSLERQPVPIRQSDPTEVVPEPANASPLAFADEPITTSSVVGRSAIGSRFLDLYRVLLAAALLAVIFGLLRSVSGVDRRQPRAL